MLNANETTAAVNALPATFDLPKGERETVRLANRSATTKIEGQFRAYLEATYASEIPAGAHEALYSLAWEHGHSNGYNETELYYDDFARLIRTALNAK